jgi:hypothetical protein
MDYKKIIKKIEWADECNRVVSGNFGRFMTITMEEAFLFKQLLTEKVNEVDESKNTSNLQNVSGSVSASLIVETVLKNIIAD